MIIREIYSIPWLGLDQSLRTSGHVPTKGQKLMAKIAAGNVPTVAALTDALLQNIIQVDHVCCTAKDTEALSTNTETRRTITELPENHNLDGLRRKSLLCRSELLFHAMRHGIRLPVKAKLVHRGWVLCWGSLEPVGVWMPASLTPGACLGGLHCERLYL